MKDTRSKPVREQLRILQRKHILAVKTERSKYTRNKELGITQPLCYLSMVIDGADQASHDLPHWASKSHMADAAMKIKLHLLGVIVHGVGTYAYTCPSHVKQGNNVTIQALWDTIVKVKHKKGYLARILLLQLDNTTKQNKGNGLFCFLAWLLYFKVFEGIEVAFLPVGHTHSDIDQFFSCIARYLRTHDCLSRDEFAACIRKSFKKTIGNTASSPVVDHWHSVANISHWLKNRHAKFTNITDFYHFRFESHDSEDAGRKTVRCQARLWPGDGPQVAWQGLNAGSFFLDVFPLDRDPPDMTQEWDSIPRAQCTTVLKGVNKGRQLFTRDRVDQMRADLEKLGRWSQKFAPGSAPYVDCMSVLTLLEIPMDESPPFHWSKHDLEFLLQPQQREVSMSENEAIAAAQLLLSHSRLGNEADRIQQSQTVPVTGLYNIMRPQAAWAHSTELFWIGLVTKYPAKRGGNGADQDDNGYLWLKLEPYPTSTVGYPQTDPYKLRYCVLKDSVAEFAPWPCNTLQDVIKMRKEGQFMYVDKSKVWKKLDKKLKSYVLQWQEPVAVP